MMSFEQVVEKYGPWNNTNIEYAPGKFTLGRPPAPNDWDLNRATWIAQLAEWSLRRPIKAMRVLDLGCFEGAISHNLALMGADVVGLEVRETNIARCNFVAESVGLPNARYVQGDMLALDRLELGQFDLIVCSGVLYHVDAPDLLPFLRSLCASCRGVMVLDTHVSLDALETYEIAPGLRAYGRSIREHMPDTTDEQKDTSSLASYRNEFSFWLTERSLMNALDVAGFQFVVKPMLPHLEWTWKDRSVWVADARAPVGRSLSKTRYRDPDPRPPIHGQFDLELHAAPNNPSTTKLY
jgi:SAM-dependent methyltransferase